MAHRLYTRSFNTKHAKPVLLDCNFIVDSTNGNGLGIRSLKGPGIQNVFMHTTQSPGIGNNGVKNPNPQGASGGGVIVVQLQDNYFQVFSGGKSVISPVSGSALKIDNSALTAGVPYIITTVGNSTPAAFHALGLPLGVVPVVGASFIASSVGAGANTSTSRVMTTSASGAGIMTIETVGDSNLAIGPDPRKNQGFGAQFILQCHDYAGNNAAPADGTVISLQFYLGDSSSQVQGG